MTYPTSEEKINDPEFMLDGEENPIYDTKKIIKED